ncbi:MAG TPA: prepilin-type N-terminal cleavage/methylation domain-containing protein [Desulfarculaceae bacterium]|nr:prepilin-type N-terminal cleavage/methylation domain-containing protein [Desulfarculaceae bacterium]
MGRNNNKGFTIIELMVAMGVLAFGILGFTFLNCRALNNRTFSRDLSRATVTAERFAESLMYLEYDDPLLDDNNSDAVATRYPLTSASDGDTVAISLTNYSVITKASAKWLTVMQGKQPYYIRWEIVTGSNLVAGTPDDKVKLIRIFAAFEKKDINSGNIVLGGYNPTRIGPTIITFKVDES